MTKQTVLLEVLTFDLFKSQIKKKYFFKTENHYRFACETRDSLKALVFDVGLDIVQEN
jgi:hypothetical protein